MALGHSAFAEAPIASAAGVSATVAVTGLPITSAHGSLVLSGTSNVTLTGQPASTTVGTVSNAITVTLSGQPMTSSLGGITPTGTSLVDCSSIQQPKVKSE